MTTGVLFWMVFVVFVMLLAWSFEEILKGLYEDED